MKRRSIHVQRAYLRRINDRRIENRMRKIKHRGGIHLYRQHGARTKDAIKMHHTDRILGRRYGF